jgi:hypothetical protein
MGQFKGSKWLDVIERILLEAERPMEAEDIARSAINQGLMRSTGMLPGDSVRRVISQHIAQDFNSKGFVVTGGIYSRRYTVANDPKIRAMFRTDPPQPDIAPLT